MRVRFTPAARTEASEAAKWYTQQEDLCEIEDFTVLIGGNGNDELVLPVPVEELPENVEIYEFETITVDDTRAYAADCHNPPPTE